MNFRYSMCLAKPTLRAVQQSRRVSPGFLIQRACISKKSKHKNRRENEWLHREEAPLGYSEDGLTNVPQYVFTNMIMATKSPMKLLQVWQRSRTRCERHSNHAAATLVQLARVSKYDVPNPAIQNIWRRSAVMTEVLVEVEKWMASYNARATCNILYALGVLQLNHPDVPSLSTQLAARLTSLGVEEEADKFSNSPLHRIASTVWGLERLGQKDHPAMQLAIDVFLKMDVADRYETHPKHYGSFAMTLVRIGNRDPELWEVLLDRFLDHRILWQDCPRAVANFVWAVLKADPIFNYTPKLEKVLTQALNTLDSPDCEGIHVASILYGIEETKSPRAERLRKNPIIFDRTKGILVKMTDPAWVQKKNFTAREVTNCIRAIEGLFPNFRATHHDHPHRDTVVLALTNLSDRLCECCSRMKFKFRDLSGSLNVMQRMGVQQMSLAEKACVWLYQCLYDRVEEMVPELVEIDSILCISGHMNYRDEDFFRFMAEYIQGARDRFGYGKLISSVWTFHCLSFYDAAVTALTREIFKRYPEENMRLPMFLRVKLYEIVLSNEMLSPRPVVGLSPEDRKELQEWYVQVTEPASPTNEGWKAWALEEMGARDTQKFLTNKGVWTHSFITSRSEERNIVEFGDPVHFFAKTEETKSYASFKWALLEAEGHRVQFLPYWVSTPSLKPIPIVPKDEKTPSGDITDPISDSYVEDFRQSELVISRPNKPAGEVDNHEMEDEPLNIGKKVGKRPYHIRSSNVNPSGSQRRGRSSWRPPEDEEKVDEEVPEVDSSPEVDPRADAWAKTIAFDEDGTELERATSKRRSRKKKEERVFKEHAGFYG